jgi:hypothetical protein
MNAEVGGLWATWTLESQIQTETFSPRCTHYTMHAQEQMKVSVLLTYLQHNLNLEDERNDEFLRLAYLQWVPA